MIQRKFYNPIEAVVKGHHLIPLEPVYIRDIQHFRCCIEKPLVSFETTRSRHSVNQELVLEVHK